MPMQVDTFLQRDPAALGSALSPTSTGGTLALSGIFAVGGALDTTAGVKLTGALPTTGTSAYGIYNNITLPATATTAGFGVYVQLKTAASTFTMTNAYGLYIANASKGTDSAITTNHGLYIAAQTAGGSNFAIYSGGGINQFVDSAYIGASSTNAKVTLGLTINQGANDNGIFEVKSSDVAHGMTDYTETDSYGHFQKWSATAGGFNLWGLTETNVAIALTSFVTTEDTTRSTSAIGALTVESYVKSGTGVANASANVNLAVFRAGSSARFILDSDGDAHADVSWTTFDTYDDIALVRGLDLLKPTAIRTEFDNWITTKKEDLIAAGILAPDDKDGNPGFLNTSALQRLHNGAIWQLAKRIMAIEQRLAGGV